MTHPSVSVIIPAYRASRTIGRALDSVLAQTCPPDEIVIVDDGSPDEKELLAALEPYRHRVLYIRQPNGGAASARNMGIDRSRGELIAFLDADDYWEPTKLEKQQEIFRRHGELGLVASRFFHEPPGKPRFDPSSRADLRRFGSFPEDRVVQASGDEVLRIATRVWTSTVLLRRTALGDERFVSGLEPAEDRDLWIRVLAWQPAYLSSEPLATAVMEPQSLSRSNVARDYGNMVRVVRRHLALLSSRELRRWEGVLFRLWAAGHLAEGQPRAAVSPAWERLRREPSSVEGWWVLLKAVALAYRPSRSTQRPPRPEPSPLASVSE